MGKNAILISGSIENYSGIKFNSAQLYSVVFTSQSHRVSVILHSKVNTLDRSQFSLK